jgi:hypothetical protein
MRLVLMLPLVFVRFSSLGEHALERVVAGNAVGPFEEPAEDRLLGAPVLGDVLPSVGPGDHRARRDDQDVGERVQVVGRLDPRVRQVREQRGQREGHRASS